MSFVTVSEITLLHTLNHDLLPSTRKIYGNIKLVFFRLHKKLPILSVFVSIYIAQIVHSTENDMGRTWNNTNTVDAVDLEISGFPEWRHVGKLPRIFCVRVDYKTYFGPTRISRRSVYLRWAWPWKPKTLRPRSFSIYDRTAFQKNNDFAAATVSKWRCGPGPPSFMHRRNTIRRQVKYLHRIIACRCFSVRDWYCFSVNSNRKHASTF